MRKYLPKILLLVSVIFLSSCWNDPDGVSVVGVDKYGNEIERGINKERFSDDMLELINDASTVVLETTESIQFKSGWELETLTIGVGVEASFGISHVVSLSSSGRFRLAFSRNPSPLLPNQN